MADTRIRIVIEGQDRNARSTIKGVSDALTNMGGQARGIGGSLQRVFEFAGGSLVADGIRNIAGSLVDLGSQALDSYASFERLTMSLETFAARELLNAGAASNMGEALGMSGERAQYLLGWIEKLAVESPFQSSDIASAFRLAQAYGFTSDQAMRLTQATVDYAAGAGISGPMMDRISLALGQIQARGKVSAQELNQLSEAGINARQILAEAFGVSTAAITDMIERGLVPANIAVEAITKSMEEDFGGAAKRQANTFSGLISSLADLKQIGLREFFTGTFQAIQPLLVDFVSTVTNPAVKAEFRAWGDALGQKVAAGVTQVTTAIAAFQSGGFTGLAQALQIPPLIIAGLTFAAQNIDALKGAALGLGAVLAAGAVVSGLTAVAGALAAILSPIGLVTLGAMALGVAWTTNLGGIQEKTQAVIDFLRPGFAELLSWISAASQGDFAPLQAGLQGALQSVSATIQAFRWEDFVTKLADWGSYITALDWTSIITTAIDWATWIPALTWAGFITAIEWSVYVSAFAWSAFVSVLDWATAVGEGITWTDFVNALAWTEYIAAFTWDSFVTKLEWTGSIAKLENWGTYISQLDWKAIITTTIDWGTWVYLLPWNTFVKVLEWSVFIAPFAWSAFVTTLSNWGAFITSLPWGDYITTLGDWVQFVKPIIWSSFVANAAWPSFIPPLTWSTFVGSVDWSAWLTVMEWSGFVAALVWSAFVPTFTWSSFVQAVDLASYIPAFPGWSSLLNAVGLGANAAGTNAWTGGPTWVGEKGAELIQYPGGQWAWAGAKGPMVLDLPAGTRIYNHEDSLRMAGGSMAGVAAIGMNAGGTTKAPAIWPGGGSTFGDLTQAAQLGANYIARGGATAGKHISSAMKKATDELKSALRSVPGLFGASQVTQQQMDLAALGVPQNFADDWIRRLTDETINGVNWEGVDIKDAAIRAGIDPSLPAKAILELVKEQWNDSSFFAGGKNTELINQDAVQQALAKQAAAKSGQNAIMQMFGITPEQATGQAVALGTTINAGVQQGLTGGSAGSPSGVGMQLLTNLASGITPEALAPVATQITNGIVSSMNQSSDAEKGAGGVDIGLQIANAIVGQLATSDALGSVGQTILQKIVDSWSTISNIDIASKIAGAMNLNLGTADAIQILQDVGKRIFKIVFQGYDAAASGADYVSPVRSGVNNAEKASATTTVETPAGRSYGRAAGLVAAAEGGVTLHNTFVVNNQLDIMDVAYQVADLIQKRSRR